MMPAIYCFWTVAEPGPSLALTQIQPCRSVMCEIASVAASNIEFAGKLHLRGPICGTSRRLHVWKGSDDFRQAVD